MLANKPEKFITQKPTKCTILQYIVLQLKYKTPIKNRCMSGVNNFNCKIIYGNIVHFVGHCIINYNLIRRNAYHNNSEKKSYCG